LHLLLARCSIAIARLHRDVERVYLHRKPIILSDKADALQDLIQASALIATGLRSCKWPGRITALLGLPYCLLCFTPECRNCSTAPESLTASNQ